MDIFQNPTQVNPNIPGCSTSNFSDILKLLNLSTPAPPTSFALPNVSIPNFSIPAAAPVPPPRRASLPAPVTAPPPLIRPKPVTQPLPAPLQHPNVLDMHNDLFSSASTSEKWGDPTYENIVYIHNLQYLAELFRTNPYEFIALIRTKFPKIPDRVLKTLFLPPGSTIPRPEVTKSPDQYRHRPARCFSELQVGALKRRYAVSPHISRFECEQLGQVIDMRPEQIRQWFNSEKHRMKRASVSRQGRINDGVRLSF